MVDYSGYLPLRFDCSCSLVGVSAASSNSASGGVKNTDLQANSAVETLIFFFFFMALFMFSKMKQLLCFIFPVLNARVPFRVFYSPQRSYYPFV
jgi:hypothetical protein